jgi:hypothetical protein
MCTRLLQLVWCAVWLRRLKVLGYFSSSNFAQGHSKLCHSPESEFYCVVCWHLPVLSECPSWFLSLQEVTGNRACGGAMSLSLGLPVFHSSPHSLAETLSLHPVLLLWKMGSCGNRWPSAHEWSWSVELCLPHLQELILEIFWKKVYAN